MSGGSLSQYFLLTHSHIHPAAPRTSLALVPAQRRHTAKAQERDSDSMTSRLGSTSFGPTPTSMGREYWDFWDPPETLFKQKFGSLLSDKEMDERFRSRFADFSLDSPLRRDFLSRNSSAFRQEMNGTGTSTVKNDANSFQIMLDVSQFKAEEVNVKTTGNEVIIHAKHEEREDEHGIVAREFTRRYLLPLGVDPDRVACFFDSRGILAIKAPKEKQETGVNGRERLIRVHKDEKVIEKKSHVEETVRTSSAGSSSSSSSSSTKTVRSSTTQQPPTAAAAGATASATNGKKSPLMTDV